MCCKLTDSDCLPVFLSHRLNLFVLNDRGETALEVSLKFSGIDIERSIRLHYTTAILDNGRFYLHQLLESGSFAWSTKYDIGVKEILNENEKSIEELDPVTGLHLFELASSNKGNLDSAFELLRRAPYLLHERQIT